MSDQAVTVTSPPQLQLPSVLDVTAAAQLKTALLDVLGSGGCVNIDASAVQRATTPCLQVLIAAATALRDGGGRLRLHSVPSALSETIAMLGLAEILGTGEA